MIETLNDALSLATIIGLIIFCIGLVIASYSSHRKKKIIEMENEYYDYSDDDDTDDSS